LGGLFFFSLSFADSSPVFSFLRDYAAIPFGEIGLYIFFALCFLVGILIMAKGYLMKLLVRQFFLVMIIVSAILNFPIVDGDGEKYEKLGGYLSRPVLYVLNLMFGGKNIAIKAFVILLLIGLIVRIFYSFNMSLPKFSLKTEDKPNRPVSKAKPSRYQAEEEEEEEEEEKPDFHQPVSRSLIKSLLKQKIEDKISQKEKKAKPLISFGGEKPTFNVAMIESGSEQAVTIDETFLMEKAKALQNKLMEFNVPIMIE
jgi:prepilin signal peptidase PulO-like enzyme (type II secretory pathway)